MKIEYYIISFVLASFAFSNTAYAQLDCSEPVCPESITVVHVAGGISPVDDTITYQTVQYDTLCWIAQNLGAAVQADSATDGSYEARGWFWQFNRKQGYNSNSGSLTPNDTWVSSITEDTDWQPGSDPCALLLGPAWRIPTSTEWTEADALGSWTTRADAYTSVLKLHGAGYLEKTNQALTKSGDYGYYWCSTSASPTNGNELQLHLTESRVINSSKTYGFSLRCCRDL